MSPLHSPQPSAEDVATFLLAEPTGPITMPPDGTEGRTSPVMFEVDDRHDALVFPRRIRDPRVLGEEADIIRVGADLTNPMRGRTPAES